MRLIAAGLALLVIFSLTACGGGDSAPRPMPIPDATILPGNPKTVLADLGDGFHADTLVTLTLTSNGYFAANPAGHCALVARADLSATQTVITGQGLAIGNVSETYNGNPVTPAAQIEVWGYTPAPYGHLLAPSSAAPVLRDGVPYTFRFWSRIDQPGAVPTVRMTITEAGLVIYDTGPMADPSHGFDVNKNGLWFAHVFDNAASGWSISLTDISVSFD
jgi:hypothetical protein